MNRLSIVGVVVAVIVLAVSYFGGISEILPRIFPRAELPVYDSEEKTTSGTPQAPAAHDPPAADEAPVADETPTSDDMPVTDDTPAIDTTPVPDDASAVDDTPVPGETPTSDDMPVTDDTPAGDTTPVPDDAPAVDDTPVAETPTSDDMPVTDDTPAGGTTPVPDAPAVDDTPAPKEPDADESMAVSKINPPEYMYGTWNDVNDAYDYWTFGDGVVFRSFINRNGQIITADFNGPIIYENAHAIVDENSYTLIWYAPRNTHVYRFVRVSDDELRLIGNNVTETLRRSTHRQEIGSG